jgi:hypothetical protein
MPFRLKNVGATFQRCIRRVFGKLIGCVIEAYVDDILVKSKKTGDLVPDLTEVFAKLRQHGVKLNPEKCIFGVLRGMLLGFVMSERGIEANPDKISAIVDMGPIKNLKGVQLFTGCLAALSRFIARLREHSLPLYKLMKKSDHFTWTPEAQQALDSLKPQESSDIDRSDRRANAPVHLSDNPSGQRGFGGRAGRAREVPNGATTSVLRQRGTFRIQDALLTDAEACVHDLDDQAQALKLL